MISAQDVGLGDVRADAGHDGASSFPLSSRPDPNVLLAKVFEYESHQLLCSGPDRECQVAVTPVDMDSVDQLVLRVEPLDAQHMIQIEDDAPLAEFHPGFAIQIAVHHDPAAFVIESHTDRGIRGHVYVFVKSNRGDWKI
jgi:hypothetical protein